MTKKTQQRLDINTFIIDPSSKLIRKQAKFQRTDNPRASSKAISKKPAWLVKRDHQQCVREAKITEWIIWLQETGHADYETGRPERLLDVCGDAPCLPPGQQNWESENDTGDIE